MSFPETVDEILDVSEDEGEVCGVCIDTFQDWASRNIPESCFPFLWGRVESLSGVENDILFTSIFYSASPLDRREDK